MQATIYVPDYDKFVGQSRTTVVGNIMMGNMDTIKRVVQEGSYRVQGHIIEDMFPEVEGFLEWIFDFTNTDEKWRSNKGRGMSVGDVVVILGHGSWACANEGFVRIDL